jgi:hypothetical protein
MALPILAVDEAQAVPVGLSGLNVGVLTTVIADATVSGANTYAVFRARVAANINAIANVEWYQSGYAIVLRALDIGNRLGILVDSNLNGLTTVAAVRSLFTNSYPGGGLPTSYTGSSPQ